jgi:hypothetical protein
MQPCHPPLKDASGRGEAEAQQLGCVSVQEGLSMPLVAITKSKHVGHICTPRCAPCVFGASSLLLSSLYCCACHVWHTSRSEVSVSLHGITAKQGLLACEA